MDNDGHLTNFFIFQSLMFSLQSHFLSFIGLAPGCRRNPLKARVLQILVYEMPICYNLRSSKVQVKIAFGVHEWRHANFSSSNFFCNKCHQCFRLEISDPIITVASFINGPFIFFKSFLNQRTEMIRRSRWRDANRRTTKFVRRKMRISLVTSSEMESESETVRAS